MDMMLDQLYYDFISDPQKGVEFVEWRNKQISARRRRLAEEIEREERLRNEADAYEE